MLWISKYSSALLIHVMHCFSSPSNLGNSSFTLIWYPCAWGIDIDGMLKRGTSCGGVVSCWPGDLGVFGGGVFNGSRCGLWLGGGNEVCRGSLAKILSRDSSVFFYLPSMHWGLALFLPWVVLMYYYFCRFPPWVMHTFCWIFHPIGPICHWHLPFWRLLEFSTR